MMHAAGMAPTQHTMTAGMYLAHVAAALTAAWWLRRGEAAVWSLGRALALALVTPLVLLVAMAVAAGMAAIAALAGGWTPPRWLVDGAFTVPNRLGPGRLLRFTMARRGPPMAVAAAV
jgi:drug/metabolite transporter superfamily protein YnfA